MNHFENKYGQIVVAAGAPGSDERNKAYETLDDSQVWIECSVCYGYGFVPDYENRRPCHGCVDGRGGRWSKL